MARRRGFETVQTGDSRGLKHNLVDVAPRPILAWLNRLYERMVI
jgi:hypothetical protein